MKRLSLIIQMLFLVLAVTAQKKVTQLISPEINGSSVTFRLKAPKAIKVLLNGDFLPKIEVVTRFGKGLESVPVEMTEREDAIWEYTFSNISPDFYTY